MPSAYIVPPLQLVAYVLIYTHRTVSQTFMEGYTSHVGLRDSGVGVVKALQYQASKELCIKCAGYTFFTMPLVHIFRNVYCPLVRLTGSVPATISVSQNTSLEFTDQPRRKPK